MVFAYPTNSPFVSTKPVKMKRKMSTEAKLIHDYIENHDFSITVDDAGACNVVVTEKEKDE